MASSNDDLHHSKQEYFTPAIASKYVTSIFSSPMHNAWISSLIHERLELQSGHRLVDMGCGPGVEAMLLLNKMNNAIHVIGVDPSQGMVDEFRKLAGENPNVEAVCIDAVRFSQTNEFSPYDRMLLKSVIHLIAPEQLPIALQGFYRQLAPKHGKLLIVRSSYIGEIAPFDERTKNLFYKDSLLHALHDQLRQAGFTRVEEETVTFEFPPGSVTVDDWLYIAENRLWTPLSKENINDEQMKDLLHHIRQQFESSNGFQTISKQLVMKCSTD